MTNEAVKVELYGANNDGNPIRYTCASGTAIAKGTLLKFSGDNTVAAHDGEGNVIAGIAAMDKANNDYSTTISVWTDGTFEMAGSGILLGGPVGPGMDANTVSGVLESGSGAQVIGYAREAFGATRGTANVRVKL